MLQITNLYSVSYPKEDGTTMTKILKDVLFVAHDSSNFNPWKSVKMCFNYLPEIMKTWSNSERFHIVMYLWCRMKGVETMYQVE